MSWINQLLVLFFTILFTVTPSNAYDNSEEDDKFNQSLIMILLGSSLGVGGLYGFNKLNNKSNVSEVELSEILTEVKIIKHDHEALLRTIADIKILISEKTAAQEEFNKATIEADRKLKKEILSIQFHLVRSSDYKVDDSLISIDKT